MSGRREKSDYCPPDADMEMTTRIAADSAFGCAGQRCLAASVAGHGGRSASYVYRCYYQRGTNTIGRLWLG
jgi:hypothetical protein